MNDTSSTSGVLTEEMMRKTFERIKRQSDEWSRAPKGPCGCPACTVHPKTKERLENEGGWAICANCMSPFHIA